jgi:hypothetical protein
MQDNKQACARYLAQRFRGSSDWRRCQSAKFPNDTRNPKAQRRLLELEAEIAIPDGKRVSRWNPCGIPTNENPSPPPEGPPASWEHWSAVVQVFGGHEHVCRATLVAVAMQSNLTGR